MSGAADICLIVEGGYPYMLGGVSSWTDALIRSMPDRSFHVVAITIASQPRIARFAVPDNVVGITDLLLDSSPAGLDPGRVRDDHIRLLSDLLFSVLSTDRGESFKKLVRAIASTRIGHTALLSSKPSWRAMERAYDTLVPNAPLVDFFWAWRFLSNTVLSIIGAPIPEARLYHAVATGYAGLFGARARLETGRPLIVTEHGIYTNERRIETSVVEWIYESTADGFDVVHRTPGLRDVWQGAFSSFSRIAYNTADVIVTQYRANQVFQLLDGAEERKFRTIQNGVDLDQFAHITPDPTPRRPTVLLIARLVPIKDVVTFIQAINLLREQMPNVEAKIIGPDDEDPGYAEECRALARQLGLHDVLHFLGKVRDIKEHLGKVDLLALTSISEAQPMALLEAGAAGLPAVTTDVGSCREILEGFDGDPVKGRAGIVVPACNPQATADAMATILRDAKMRAGMGVVMRARVNAVYNKTRITRLWTELYDSLGATVREHV